MKRVCHILSGDLWAGAEAQALHLTRALATDGRYDAEVVLFNDLATAARFRDAGVRVHVADESVHGLRGLVRAVREALDDRAPVHVHTHGYKEDIVAAWALRGRPTGRIRTQHGSPYARTTLRIAVNHRIDRLIARAGFDRTIAVSEAVRRELLRFLPPEKVVTIPNGIPCGEGNETGGTMPVASPFPDGTFVIGSAGRLAPEKRFDLLIDTVAELRARGIPAAGLVLGEGPEAESLRARAEGAAPDRIHFAGFQPEIAPWLAIMDLFVITSDREGLPTVLLEAWEERRAVVSRAVGGIPDVLADGRNGALVAGDDASALADACEALARDPERIVRYGEEGRAVVRARFSSKRAAAATADLYETVEREKDLV